MHELTGFQRDLMFAIAGLEVPNGVQVRQELEKYYGTEVRHGRLYPNLDKLVETGLVHKGHKNRRTNEYSLTEDGRDALADRLSWQSEHTTTIDLDISQLPASAGRR